MGGPPHTQEAGPWLTPATSGGATVAEKCEKEKKAYDKATARCDMAEGRLNDLEFEIQEWEAEAERALGSIGECNKEWTPLSPGGMRSHTEGHYRLDEKCVIDQWVYAYKLLDAARRWRSGSVYMDYLTRLEQMREDEERRKDAYCACLNGETPP
jgi:hypothetical protein